jgi:hypothetical protein
MAKEGGPAAKEDNRFAVSVIFQDPGSQNHGQQGLQRITGKGQQTEGFSQLAADIGGAYIAAAVLADINPFAFPKKQSAGNGADKVCKNDENIGHGNLSLS